MTTNNVEEVDCYKCQGRGWYVTGSMFGNEIDAFEETCDLCNGTGKLLKLNLVREVIK